MSVAFAVLLGMLPPAAVGGCPRVVTATGNANRATGATVAVRDGHAIVLTALHAVPTPEDREVQFFTPVSYPRPARTVLGVRTLFRAAESDLAVLQVKVGTEGVPTLPLAPATERIQKFPTPGWSLGCSNGRPPTPRPETLTGKQFIKRPTGGGFFWETGRLPVPGRSGGPLFDDQGRLIGICSAGRDNRGYYAHLDELRWCLKQAGLADVWPPAGRP